jgi:predicted transcriptional regulator
VIPTLLKPDLYVVSRFLEALWWDTSGMKKTQLQMSVGLNYQTFLKYLKWLEQHSLVKIIADNEGNERIVLSEKEWTRTRDLWNGLKKQ